MNSDPASPFCFLIDFEMKGINFFLAVQKNSIIPQTHTLKKIKDYLVENQVNGSDMDFKIF